MYKEQQQQQEKIEMLQQQEEIQKQLVRARRRRPNLQDITRKRKLSSQAESLYNNVIKLQIEKRRLKKVIKRLKNNESKRLTISTTDYKDNNDKTALVQQIMIDMQK